MPTIDRGAHWFVRMSQIAMRGLRLFFWLNSLGLLFFVGIPIGYSQSSSSDRKTESTVSNASPDQTNVATESYGAKHGNVRGKTSNFDDLIQGKPQTIASLTPASNGAVAITTIDLPKAVNLDRVVLDLSKSKGRLVVIAMSDKGEALDLTTPEGAARVIADRKLSGAESEVTFDASKISAKSVMFYWVPDEPGGSLTLSGLGLFSSTPGALPPGSSGTDKAGAAKSGGASTSPSSANAPEVAAVTTPVPVMPSPEVLASVMVTVESSSSRTAVASAGSNSSGSNSSSGAAKSSVSSTNAPTAQSSSSSVGNTPSNSGSVSTSGGVATPSSSVTSQTSRPVVLPPVIQPISQPVSL